MATTLRQGDGFRDKGTAGLMPEIERLQRALRRSGRSVEIDGLFGSGTASAVRAFQKSVGLKDDGIVGPATWRALKPFIRAADAEPSFDHVPGLESFHGDLQWVHEREGHNGKAYWPGGRSGVTLDPGFDLGHQTLAQVRKIYGTLFDADQYSGIRSALGKKGQAAKAALANSKELRSVRVSRSRALKAMPFIAVDYWKGVVRRFPELANEETPSSVQTVLLSLAYNRGARNPDLEQLATPIARARWLDVARKVGNMQQDHELAGIRIRRRMKADLIRAELEFG